MKNTPITIAGQTVSPGTQTTLLLPSADLYTQTKMDIPVHVFHGKLPGPKLFIISTIHGDELNGIEIIRRVQHQSVIKHIRGTLITIPVANVFGFVLQQRYLPDRRDLNRSFPGSKTGSLAARLANILIEEIVSQCNYGIDLHTGAYGRLNVPQLRVNLETPGAREFALAFDPPVILDAKLRDGSLREAASELGIPLLVYEGGEALRFNELCIRGGVHGIMNVLAALEMIPPSRAHKKSCHDKTTIAEASRWLRAEVSGLVQPIAPIAKTVKKGETLAFIHDPFLQNKSYVLYAPFDGIVIGLLNLPLVNAGDAMYHLASFEALQDVTAGIDNFIDEFKDVSLAGNPKR